MADEKDEKKPTSLSELIEKAELEARKIWLGSEVNDESALELVRKLEYLAAQDSKKDIFLWIDSPGGSITAGMTIYDTIQRIEPDVVTIASGLAASMGQFLLSSGAKGKRYATPHARVMMHQPSGGVGGTTTDVRINAELIMHMKRILSELTAEQTGKSLDQVLEDNEHDNWFTADEAKEYGFIDHILTDSHQLDDGKVGA